MAYSEVLTALPSCGVGGPNAQAAEAEKILSCAPDIVISQYEDVDKADALQSPAGRAGHHPALRPGRRVCR